MVFLKEIIVLASMTYIITNVNAYECHQGMKKSSLTLSTNAMILHYTYDRA